MTRYAVLLRGINVGTQGTKVSMPRLREIAEELGWTDVSTYINSGNLFADCGGASRASVEKALAKALHDDLGKPVDVVARTRAQLQKVVDANPFPDAEQTFLHVAFLTGKPSAAGVKAFEAELDKHPEQGVVIGTEAYVDYVNGSGRSKLPWDKIAKAMGVEGHGPQLAHRADPAREGLMPDGLAVLVVTASSPRARASVARAVLDRFPLGYLVDVDAEVDAALEAVGLLEHRVGMVLHPRLEIALERNRPRPLRRRTARRLKDRPGDHADDLSLFTVHRTQ